MSLTKNYKGDDLNPLDVAVPCGLIAKSFFRDSEIEINQNDIIWEVVKKIKFDNLTEDKKKNNGLIWQMKFYSLDASIPVSVHLVYTNFRKLWWRIKKGNGEDKLKKKNI